MKKNRIGLAIIVTFLSCFSLLSLALAQADNPVNINEFTQSVGQKGGYTTTGVDDKSLAQSVGRVIKIVLSLTGVIFLALTVYAGFLWMTAGGETEKIEKAQNIVKAATMGLVIVIGSYGIVVFILASIGAATNTTSSTVGGVGPGAGSFWSSFGKNFKNSWWKYIF